jgi:truncated hemoglobin YjbI
LFLFRLLDSTQVAIDVGRERMGTDKRPGAIDVRTEGNRVRVSIADQWNHGVLRGEVPIEEDPVRYMSEIARAAATAGIPLRRIPPGSELSYPVVARIGRGPTVEWQWRSDAGPSLQPVPPGSVVIEPFAEEGRILQAWGFAAKVLAHFPHVRGVVTGIGDEPVPVLRLVPSDPAAVPAAPKPRYAWDTGFLGSLTAFLRKEVVGATPDGFRINWHVTHGTFAGPGFDAVVLPGAADWMRIRPDGVAIVNVQACFEMRDGARVFGSYGGIFDLGSDGYARALREDWPTLPPVVVTPTYATADPRLDWLNRAQCIGVGRVDMTALRVEFDVYIVRVGPRADQDTLYARVGGQRAIEGITDDFVAAVLADRQLARFFSGPVQANLRDRVVDLLCQLTGGPCAYRGRDMKAAHRGMGIDGADWRTAVHLFAAALERLGVKPAERAEFIGIIEQMKDDIVEVRP